MRVTVFGIVTEMTAQGLLAANGKPLTYNTICNMLHNRRYIGEYSFRETILPDCVPAIVPRDLFDRVQERLERNKKAPARYKAEEEYLLSTIRILVYAAEQIYGAGRGSTKYQYVEDELDKRGLSVDAAAIEATVREMNLLKSWETGLTTDMNDHREDHDAEAE